MLSFKSAMSIVSILVAFTLIACAPEDKRFQAKSNKKTKETITYSKKKVEGKSTSKEKSESKKSKKVTKAKNGTKKNASKTKAAKGKSNKLKKGKVDRTAFKESLKRKIDRQKLSGIKASDIVIKLNKLQTTDADQTLQDKDLKAVVNLVDKSSLIALELATSELQTSLANSDEINLDNIIVIKTEELNKKIKDIKDLNNNANLKLQVNLVKKSIDNLDDDKSCSILSSMEINFRDVTSNEKEYVTQSRTCQEDTEKSILLTFKMYSEGQFKVTTGSLKENSFKCSAKAENLVQNEFQISATELIGTSENSQNILDLSAVASDYSENEKKDLIVFDEINGGKALVTLTEDSCELSQQNQVSRALEIIYSDKNSTITVFNGCCVKQESK